MSYIPPNYTMVPNALLDKDMATMGNAELRVVLAVARKTLGWHKKKDRISLSQLQTMTGLGRQAVLRGLEDALKHGHIYRVKCGNSYEYWLAVSDEDGMEIIPPDEPNSMKIIPAGSMKIIHTKETIQNKKDSIANHPALMAYREEARLQIPVAWRERVIAAVGSTPARVASWRQVVADWIGSGYNPRNVKGMLGVLQNGWKHATVVNTTDKEFRRTS